LLYEGAVCGSIPIIRNLEEYYDNELLHGISGIFNGSSNYILSKIFNDNLPYEVALQQAQDLGFAETDPILDVGGYDPKFKLAIATAHAYGLFINPDKILNVELFPAPFGPIRAVILPSEIEKLIPFTMGCAS